MEREYGLLCCKHSLLLQQEIIHVWVSSNPVGCWLGLLTEKNTEPFLGINYPPLQNDLKHMGILLASSP